MFIRRIQRVKACNDLSAAAAHIMPLHAEQARFPRMQKQINDLSLIVPAISRVLDRIDLHDLIVRHRPHESLQLPNQIIVVRITRAESVETLPKKRFTGYELDAIHGHTSLFNRKSVEIPRRSKTSALPPKADIG